MIGLRATHVAWLVVAACSSAPPPSARSTPASSAMPIDPTASLAIESEEITFAAGTNTVPGTLVRPAAPGPRRAVVLMAGSGPTDRD